ncbi:hypothetical protein CBR_g50761 [Chara braunii]|uniref:Gamma-tubulin complex component n=1 Tax=Chara braunii TaxID=69332 RepID=A0A388K5R9_CHABU|nr:hypothetical protein CBR_g50761 [Chara braunii]|eukprot:GBG65400.1 hypothetical protein CBR_g50761 [Chara braunii]
MGERMVLRHIGSARKALQAKPTELAERVLPLCESYCAVSRFVEVRSHFKHGLASHALAAAIRSLLQDYQMMIAQLEHQFNLGRLSLQGLWFYCQPMMGAMQVLSMVVHRAFAENLTGASLLNLLQSQAGAIAGDSSSHALLMKLLQSASAPYLAMLEKWIYEGTINDPYGEFLVEENKNVLKNPAAEANAVKKNRFGHFATEHTYLERINIGHNFASQELLKVIIQKADLMGRLRSVKHYFLLEKGDFLVHFMDIAREELTKRPALISLEKLQSLLELALRTSVCAIDPYHEDLTCGLVTSPLLRQQREILSVNLALKSRTSFRSSCALASFARDFKEGAHKIPSNLQALVSLQTRGAPTMSDLAGTAGNKGVGYGGRCSNAVIFPLPANAPFRAELRSLHDL